MLPRLHVTLALAALFFLAAAPRSACPQPSHGKTVWNYDGGIAMLTDGSLKEGPCFRLSGKVTAGEFFENLKRVDTLTGTIFRRGNDIVTEFPEKVHLNFVIYDQPCPERIQKAGTHVYLNYKMMQSLRMRFYWKRGTDLRPAKGLVPVHMEAQPVPSYAGSYTKDLPEMYEWFFEFDVPSKGVPVTDSLVIVLLTADGEIAARVAARM